MLTLNGLSIAETSALGPHQGCAGDFEAIRRRRCTYVLLTPELYEPRPKDSDVYARRMTGPFDALVFG